MHTGFMLTKLTTSKLYHMVLAFCGVLFVAYLVFTPYLPSNVRLREGFPAPRTIVSPRSIEFESKNDKLKTLTLRSQKQAKLEKIYTVDEDTTQASISDISHAYGLIRDFREEKKKNPNMALPEALGFISGPHSALFLNLDAKSLNMMEYLTVKSAQMMLQEGIQDASAQKLLTLYDQVSPSLEMSSSQKDIVMVFILTYLKPNLVYSEDKTKARMDQSSHEIKSFTTILKEGEPIIYKGEMVRQVHLDALQALNIYGVKTDFIKFTGIFLITLFLFLLIERFLFYFNSYYHHYLKYYVLLYTIIVLTLIFEEVLRHLSPLHNAVDIRFLIPIPMASMLLSFLVTPSLALLCGTVICILTAISFNMDFGLFIFLFLSNCAAAFLTYKKYTRTELIWAGYSVGVVNVCLVISLGLIRDIHAWEWFVSNVVVALLNGVLSSMLALAILPYFESLFKLSTRQTLLELSNLNHPLLKRLMTSAPGTYQHSLMVANLGEAAAESIQADPILTRVGAYFHDIGKMKRPGFFTENQSGENPHTGLAPRMSKMIISAHVKEGVELAEKYKLPEILKSFILEHHGTTMVSFFYTQALQTEDIKNQESIKEEFRYPGPKPHLKEIGIVMLADSVEAASRSLEKPSYSKIEALVDRIFTEKLSDGQLDQCPLTLKDIETIKTTFLKVFQGIYHSRLDYQEELDSILKHGTHAPKDLH